jgi:DNA-binding NarL/FixJ family response regulator
MKQRYPILITLFFFVFSVVDIWWEYSQGQNLQHLGFEFFICFIAALWSLYLWSSWIKTDRLLIQEKNSYLELNAEYQSWREKNKKTLQDMHSVITEQFDRWELTPAERDVALLLLKGLSFKDVADLRGSAEKTIRQHALKIYQKSGLPGRTELFAFFFEDLFLAKETL